MTADAVPVVIDITGGGLSPEDRAIHTWAAPTTTKFVVGYEMGQLDAWLATKPPSGSERVMHDTTCAQVVGRTARG